MGSQMLPERIRWIKPARQKRQWIGALGNYRIYLSGVKRGVIDYRFQQGSIIWLQGQTCLSMNLARRRAEAWMRGERVSL